MKGNVCDQERHGGASVFYALLLRMRDVEATIVVTGITGQSLQTAGSIGFRALCATALHQPQVDSSTTSATSCVKRYSMRVTGIWLHGFVVGFISEARCPELPSSTRIPILAARQPFLKLYGIKVRDPFLHTLKPSRLNPSNQL